MALTHLGKLFRGLCLSDVKLFKVLPNLCNNLQNILESGDNFDHGCKPGIFHDHGNKWQSILNITLYARTT